MSVRRSGGSDGVGVVGRRDGEEGGERREEGGGGGGRG